MSSASPPASIPTDPPRDLPRSGILLGYSLEHERRTAPIGFVYAAESVAPAGVGDAAPTLAPILHTGGGHLMTIAPTGAGKGVSCIVPALLRFRGPVIVIDPKGENYAVTGERRRALGQQVVVLDPMDVTKAARTDALNPLDLVDADDPQCIDDAAALASLLSGGPEKDDPRNAFWYQRGEHLLTGVIQHVALSRQGGQRTLGEVRRLLNLPAEEFIELAGREMSGSPDPDVRQVAATLVNPAMEMVGSILGMAQNGLGFLRGDLLHESTDSTSFSLDEVTSGAPLSVFIVIPPDKLASHRNLLRLWIGTLMSALMRRRAPVPHPTLLVLDEAAQLGPLDQLRQAVTLMRGYGLQTWSFWQDVSQLQNLYPRDWETMYNNCRVHQAFGFTTLNAAEAACGLLGFHDPLEALGLDSDEMILSVSGDESVIAQKPNYLSDPAFQDTFAPNPFYTDSAELPPRPSRPRRVYVRPGSEADRSRRSGVDDAAAGGAEGGGLDGEFSDESGSDAPGPGPELDLDALLAVATDEDAGGDEAPRRRTATALAPLPGVRHGYDFSVPEVVELVVDRLGGTWNPVTSQVLELAPDCYPDHAVLELWDPDHEPRRRLVVRRQWRDQVLELAPGAAGLRTLNRLVPVRLNDQTVAEYVRIFLHLARPPGHRVRAVETVEQVGYWTAVPEIGPERLEHLLEPIRAVADGHDGWRVEGTSLVGDRIARFGVVVSRDGEVGPVWQRPLPDPLGMVAEYPGVGLDGDVLDADTIRALSVFHGPWEVVGPRERELILEDLPPHLRLKVPDALPIVRRPLLCCPDFDLVSIPSLGPDPHRDLYFHRTGSVQNVRFGIQAFNRAHLDLREEAAAQEYLRLSRWQLGGPEATCLLVDRFEELPLRTDVEHDPQVLEALREAWRPVRRIELPEGETGFGFEGMLLDGLDGFHLAPRRFVVGGDGRMLIDREPDDARQVRVDEALLRRLMALPSLGSLPQGEPWAPAEPRRQAGEAP